jgi:bifunctional UDP-N-acetylglucosamine pyrophosphorylase/glucosamine-1-phosphate N-acetyltransferase
VPAYSQQGDRVPVIIEADTYRENLAMPEHLCGTPGYDIPLPDKMIVQIDHWTNLWAANISTLLEPAASLMKTPKWKLLGKALRARSLNQWKIVNKLNNIGRNCDIHPTAYIEGCVVGDNVTIGAGSVIRECNIDSNASVENNATLNFSVIGEGGYIADGSIIRYSVIYPRTFFGFSTLSCQMLGRNCFIGDGVTLADYRLDGKCVTVLKNGVVIDTANKFLGSCIGNDTYLAGGTIIAPGRTIPNGTRVNPENHDVIRQIAPDGTIKNYRQVNNVCER